MSGSKSMENGRPIFTKIMKGLSIVFVMCRRSIKTLGVITDIDFIYLLTLTKVTYFQADKTNVVFFKK